MGEAVPDTFGGVVMVVLVFMAVAVVVLVAHVRPLPVLGWTYGVHRTIMCV
jgi:hypothetical protein